MAKSKLNILFTSEFSAMLSGFGLYTREILKRLSQTGKYNLAELASYGTVNDPKDSIVGNWRYYANAVSPGDSRWDEYHSRPNNPFGAWRFHSTIMDHRSNVVIDVRDPWWVTFIRTSPLRDFYHFIMCSPVDSIPTKEDVLDLYLDANAVFTYSHWAQDELKKEGGGKINLRGVTPAGINLDVFKPVIDKEKHRSEMGLLPGINIIGTVMRNQRRKLFPQLFKDFKRCLDKLYKSGKQDLADRTYLYCHTSYPDNGYDIERTIKDLGIGHKILFTYICTKCHSPCCSFFQGGRAICSFCNENALATPSVQRGLNEEQLARVYNVFDVYVQYATCEGQSVPQYEAAACGVPVLTGNYTAMKDAMWKVAALPLEPAHEFIEPQMDTKRYYPNEKHFSQQISYLLSLPQSLIKEIGTKARKGAEKWYNWDTIAKTYETYLDKLDVTELQQRWNRPPDLYNPPQEVPPNLTNDDFCKWLVIEVLNKPQWINSYFHLGMLKDLNYGARVDGQKITKVTPKQFFENCLQYRQNYNQCEQLRCGLIEPAQEDFIEYAHLKERLNNV